MRLNDLDLNQLVILDALLRDKSITRAAERVYLSQPAMSSALRRLRQSFQDPLLVHRGRDMTLSPLGIALAQPVSEVMRKIKVITLTRPSFDPATCDRTISIIASDYTHTIFLPEVLRRVSKQAPRMKLRLLSRPENPVAHLRSGDADFLIDAGEEPVVGCTSERLFEDTFCCIAWSKNRRLPRKLDLESYQRMGHVAMEFSQGRLPTLDDTFLKKLGYSRNVEVIASDFKALPHLIVGTDRIANLQLRLAQVCCRNLPLRIMAIPIKIPPIVETLHHQNEALLDPACAWFREQLLVVAREINRSNQ